MENASDSEHFEDLNRLLTSANMQDDRTLVLSLGAYLEEALGRTLVAYLRDGNQTRELVNRHLNSLAGRITAAYALRLLSDQQYKNLWALKNVRNAFAHDWRDLTIDSPNIRAELGQLCMDGESPRVC